MRCTPTRRACRYGTPARSRARTSGSRAAHRSRSVAQEAVTVAMPISGTRSLRAYPEHGLGLSGAAFPVVGCRLAEGEAVGLGTWIKEGDLEGAVGDGAGLADELVHPLLREGAVAIGVGVGAVGLAWWLSVDADAELQ